MPTEIWLPVFGFEGYEVSSEGRVRSVDRVVPHARYGQQHLRGTVIAPQLNGDGYLVVRMNKDGKRFTRLIHRLVLTAFVGERPSFTVTRHLDNNPRNNALGNLAWGSQGENIRDQVAHGTHRNSRKTHCKRGHEFTPENTYVDADGSRRCKECGREADRLRIRRRSA